MILLILNIDYKKKQLLTIINIWNSESTLTNPFFCFEVLAQKDIFTSQALVPNPGPKLKHAK